jgi:predicted O-methyltransferase YrrM
MMTFTDPQFSAFLDQLFEQAEASSIAVQQEFQNVTPEERAAAMSSTTDYRAFYGRVKEAYLAVSRETGSLLYMLARATSAHAIVEFGTSFGLSTLHLAAALRDNGGGHLIGSEFEPSKVVKARENLKLAGLSDLVEIREGDALEMLAHDLPDTIDLLLLDGAKGLYPAILSLVETHLKPGALIVADNADWSPDYLHRVRSKANGYLSIPFAEDVELSMRLPN